MDHSTNNKQVSGYFFYLLPCLLILPAFLINIHVNPLLADEPIRALVALEMMLSNNYLVPSINGEFYYNKPPLFNWILIMFFKLTNSFDEWVVRIPTILSIIAFGISIFWTFKRHLTSKVAYLVAFATIVSGRILFYDSFLGLIDSLFSLVVFLSFMAVYHFSVKQKWLLMFLVTYGLTAVGFMLKGLPALVFTGFTLLSWLTLEKEFKRLLSWNHIAGIFLMVMILSCYYILYYQYNDLNVVFSTLWSESTKRTVAETSIFKSIKHILFFPFEFILHFLPFSLFIIFLFRKNTVSIFKSNTFIRFCIIVFAANIWVYWLSPETRPRYLFMFLPLFFVLPVQQFLNEGRSAGVRIIENIFLVFAMVVAILCWVPLFVFPSSMISFGLVAVTVFLFSAFGALIFLYWKYSGQRILIFISILLVTRIGFDIYVFPYRAETLEENRFKAHALKIAEIAGNAPVYLNDVSPLNFDISYYISARNGRIVRKIQNFPEKGSYLILHPSLLKEVPGKYSIKYEFSTMWQNTPMCLIKIE